MSDPQRKIALVIGVNGGPKTDLAPLRFAEATAKQLAEVLAAPASGFELYGGQPLLGAAATSDAVRQAVFDARRAAGRNGLLLISYIGHGHYVDVASDHSDVYLVTHNFHPAHAQDDPDAHLSMRWLQERVLYHHEPDQLLLLLDCCFAGAIGNATPDPRIANLRTRLEQALNIQRSDKGASEATLRKTLAAVGPLLPAYEADGATCYTATLLRGLNGAAALEDGRVTWQSLHAYLQQQFRATQSGEYGFDRSAGVTLASYPQRSQLRTPQHRPWVMPYALDRPFVGREAELAQLLALLTGDSPAAAALLPAVAGIGGIGKTQLAIEFAHRYRDHFPGGVFWLNMEQGDTLDVQVAACGGPRGLQLFDDEPNEYLGQSLRRLDGEGGTFERAPRLSLAQQVAQVRAIWEGPERRLLIFDNLEDPALLDRWRPRGGGCRIVITTRRQRWAAGSGVRPVPLDGLGDDDSLKLLLGPRAAERGWSIEQVLADPKEKAAAQALVRELDGLPLALTLAGGYLSTSSVSLVRYQELLQAESIKHHSLNAELREGLPSDQRASISAAFALSYERLETSVVDTLARTLWLAAAQLAPAAIMADVLLRAGGLDPGDEQQCDTGEAALRRLRELGLIEYRDNAYRLHRLLAAYARSVSHDLAGDYKRAAGGLAQTIQRLDDENELWSCAVRFRDHVQHLVTCQPIPQDSAGAALWHAAGLVMYMEEDYATARGYLQEALAIREVRLGRQHQDTATTLHGLGAVAYWEEDYATARGYYQEALAIETEVLGRRHRSTAVTLHDLGNVAREEGDYATARGYYQEALAIREALLGRRHRETAVTLHELGNVAYWEEDYATARGYLQEALAIQTEVLGRRHRSTAFTLHGLGAVAREEGDYATARGYLQEALAIQTEVLGRQHQDTATTLHALGNVAYWEEDYATARGYYQEALAIETEVLGRRHRSTAFPLHGLGNVAYSEGDYATARDYLQEALAIETEVLGRHHRSTAVTLHDLGNVAYSEGDYVTARGYYQEALAIREARLGRRHRFTAVTLHGLGNVAYSEGDYATARGYYQEALAIQTEVLGRRHRSTAFTLHGLGNVAYSEGDYATARGYYQEALAIKTEVLGRRHRETAVTLHGLGAVAREEGDYATARGYYQEALAIKTEVLGRRHRETAVTLYTLGNVAYSEGDYATARGYLQEALAIETEVLGRRHWETAFTLHALGAVAREEGDYATARGYLQEALAITTEVLGRHHRETAFPLHALGDVASQEEDYATARGYYQEALAIREALLGRRHRSTAFTLHDLGNVAYWEEDYATARDYYQEALAIKTEVLGRRHRSTAFTLHDLGNVAYLEGDYATARDYYQEALAIKTEVLGRRHRETAFTLHDLGNVAYWEEDYATARDYYQEALAIKTEVLGRHHRSTAVTLHALGAVAREEGDYATARGYYQEALAIETEVLGRHHRSTVVTRRAQRDLLGFVAAETCLCVLLIMMWLSLLDGMLAWPYDLLAWICGLLAAVGVLVLGALGYYRLPAATRLVRALLRIQIGAWLVYLLLSLIERFTGVFMPPLGYLAVAVGAVLGLCLPWRKLLFLFISRARVLLLKGK